MRDEDKIRIFNEIIDLIANGLSMRKACVEQGSITKKTFLEWVSADELLSAQYARAMEARSDVLFDEILEISDDGSNDFIEKFDSDGVPYEVLNQEHIQRSKLRVDSRKWALSKMQPKKYGDKLDVTTDGKEVNTQPTIIFKKFKNDE